MADPRYDVLVVGSGPAGAVAALVLARGGARVGLVDKAVFPRDKACGDLIGPRGVGLLDDLELPAPTDVKLGDMLVVGPKGHRVRLPSAPGLTYPGHALAVPRMVFDTMLRDAAAAAGAEPVTGRVGQGWFGEPDAAAVSGAGGAGAAAGLRLGGLVLDDGRRLRADVVIGADGATSRVGELAGLVDGGRVLWGFAVRAYLDAEVDLPVIALWDEEPGRAFPGYGWVFPGPGGRANAGLGIGVGPGGSRSRGARAVQRLPEFFAHLARLGLVDPAAVAELSEPGPAPTGSRNQSPARLGGWLKMGMVGTVPAAGNVLLVGDAAGLVNPLQGEGISQAMGSGRAAAEAVLAGPAGAATRYRAYLAAAHLPYEPIAAGIHSVLVGRPRATAAVVRLLTAPRLGPALAGGWAVFWNELLDGAPPSRARSTAAAVTHAGRLGVSGTRSARWFRQTLA